MRWACLGSWGASPWTKVALRHCDFDLAGARVAIQGFGAVGLHAARFLAAKGALLVAAADSQGTIHDAKGLDVDALVEHKRTGRSVAEFPPGKRLDRDAVIDVECEIWIPAARPDVIREDNVKRLRTRLVAPGANIPLTRGAERALHERGVLCLPDFIANAGGVICAALEYAGATQAAALQAIEERISANTEEVLAEAKRHGVPPRQAAEALSRRRVQRAMGWRRWSIF